MVFTEIHLLILKTRYYTVFLKKFHKYIFFEILSTGTYIKQIVEPILNLRWQEIQDPGILCDWGISGKHKLMAYITCYHFPPNTVDNYHQ